MQGIIKIRWQERIRNEVVLGRARLRNINFETRKGRIGDVHGRLRREGGSVVRPKTTWRRTVAGERETGWRVKNANDLRAQPLKG